MLFFGLIFCFIYFFFSNKWGFDWLLEEFFKVVELFGFGIFFWLESFFYMDGGFDRFEEFFKFLEEELRKLIVNIICDFIWIWYENVGKGEYFIVYIWELFEVLCLEGYKWVF